MRSSTPRSGQWTPTTFQAQPVALTTVPNVLDEDPSISPDGDHGRVHQRPTPIPAIVSTCTPCPLAGGTPTQLTDTPTFDETQPVWSPDGTKIAFRGQERGATNWDIYKVNADGTGRVQLTTDPARRWPAELAARSCRRRVPAPEGRHAAAGFAGARRSTAASPRTARTGRRWRSARAARPEQASRLHHASARPTRTGSRRTCHGLPAPRRDARQPFDRRRRGRHRHPAARHGRALQGRPHRSTIRTGSSTPLSMQLTDKDNGCCGFPSTLRDGVSLYTEAPCTTTADPNVGSTCDVTTTADAFIPGMVREEPARGLADARARAGVRRRPGRARRRRDAVPRPRACSSRRAQLMKSAASQGLPGAITSRKRSSSSGSIAYVCSAAGKRRSRTSSA